MSITRVSNSSSRVKPEDVIHTLSVEFALQSEGKPWSKPIYLMQWIALNPQVKQVKFDTGDANSEDLFIKHAALIWQQDGCTTHEARMRAWVGGPDDYAKRSVQ